MRWFDDGAKLKLFVSSAGDFVSVGTRTEYPFVAGGSGVPTGWTYRIQGANATFNDVNWTTSYGRFSVSNASATDSHNGNFYGTRRDFTVIPGHRYIIQVQARVMEGKTYAYRRLGVQINGAGTTYATSLIARSEWEQISFPMTATTGSTYFRVYLDANPYWGDPSRQTFDWGVQWQGFAIIDQDATYPPPTWHEVTCDVQSFTARYGRSRFTSRYDVGTCNIGVTNNDGEFVYSTSHPWGLRPGRFVKVTANEPGFTNQYELFYGIIDSINDAFTRDGKAVASISCVDISSLLANITVATVTSESSTFLSGDRLAMLSASAGWLPQNLFTQQGVYIQQTILANGRTVRDEMGLIADSEGGFFYADRLGRLVYVDRNGASTNSRWNTVQAELLAECPPDDGSLPLVDVIPTRSGAPIVHLQSFVTDWSRDRVVNDIQLANQGGSAFQVVDQTSQSKYGPRTYQRLDFLNDNTHPEYLLERSQDFMDGYTDAVMRVNSVTFRPSKADPNLYYFTLMAFLNDLVRVRYTHPTEGWGYSLVSHVQSVEHTITPSDWECKFELDQIEAFNRWDGAMGGTGWDDAIWDEGRWDGKQTGQWNRTAKWSDGISVWK